MHNNSPFLSLKRSALASMPADSHRRTLLKKGLSAVGLGLLSPSIFAQSAPSSSTFTMPKDLTQVDPVKLTGVTLVELANFTCSRCNAVNAHYPRIQEAALAANVDLVFAPVTWENGTLWPDRVYYAIRDLYPVLEPLVRDSIFYGIHEEGQAFETLSQVIAYLERRELTEQARSSAPDFDLAKVSAKADSNDPLYSEIKAGRLLDTTGAQEVPVFLWIGGGKVLGVVTPEQAPDAPALVSVVIQKLNNPFY